MLKDSDGSVNPPDKLDLSKIAKLLEVAIRNTSNQYEALNAADKVKNILDSHGLTISNILSQPRDSDEAERARYHWLDNRVDELDADRRRQFEENQRLHVELRRKTTENGRLRRANDGIRDLRAEVARLKAEGATLRARHGQSVQQTITANTIAVYDLCQRPQTVDGLVAQTRLTGPGVRKIVQGLVARGVVTASTGRPAIYRQSILHNDDARAFLALLDRAR